MTKTAETNWYSNDAATFGDRVAAARDAREMTQTTLARQLGVAKKTVDGWENDKSEPRANKLQMLSGVLDVSIPWLLTGEGQDFEGQTALGQETGEILGEVRKLRAEALGLAERLGTLEKRLQKVGS
jgi:transcriptional regulator with XRE-family HTH domain